MASKRPYISEHRIGREIIRSTNASSLSSAITRAVKHLLEDHYGSTQVDILESSTQLARVQLTARGRILVRSFL